MASIKHLFTPVLSGLLLGIYVYLSSPSRAQTTLKSSKAPTAAHLEQNRPADLTSDTRLDSQISVHEIGTPLDEMLKKVSPVNAPLFADRSCAALKLQVSLLNRPVRLLMQSLAQLVPGEWYPAPGGKGYVLRMSQVAARRRQHWWDLFLGERQRLWDEAPDRVVQAMQARPEIKGEVHSADGNDEGLKQMILAAPTFFNMLPPSLQGSIAHRLNQTPLFQTNGMYLSTGMEEGGSVVPLTALPEQAQKQLSARLQAYNLNNVTLVDTYILFENVGRYVSADVLNANGDTLTAGFSLDVKSFDESPVFPLEQYGLPSQVKKMGRNAPAVWKELSAYQESRFWPNDLPAKTYPNPRNRAKILEWLADLGHVEFVSDYYSLRGLSQSTQLPDNLSLPLTEELNKCAVEQDLSWKQQGGVYLFRSNRWYRDDGLEVPAPLLRRWLTQNVLKWAKVKSTLSFSPWTREGKRMSKEQMEKAEADMDASRPTPEALATIAHDMLDWQAEVVSTLTPWQLFNGLVYTTIPPDKREQYAWGGETARFPADFAPARLPYTPFSGFVNEMVKRHGLLLFYASLNVEQRTALLAGGLDVSTLTASQAQQAIYVHPILQIAVSRRDQPILLGIKPCKSVHGRASSDLSGTILTGGDICLFSTSLAK